MDVNLWSVKSGSEFKYTIEVLWKTQLFARMLERRRCQIDLLGFNNWCHLHCCFGFTDRWLGQKRSPVQAQVYLVSTFNEGWVCKLLSYVMIEDADDTPVNLWAMLDSVSQVRFVSESSAKSLKSESIGSSRKFNNYNTLWMVFFTKPKGVLSNVFNDAVHVDLHVVPKFSNLVPHRKWRSQR